MKFKNYLNEIKKIQWSTFVGGNPELKAALEVMKKIDDLGYEILIVGGFVRDKILGKKSNDIDLTTNMPEAEIEKYFKTFDIGKNKQFGVSVVKYKGFEFEIAQYRKDVYATFDKGKGADKVELVSDFKEDSARRDFTINSLGIDYKGNVIDHHGGTDHLDMKIICAVGDPHLRFKEDPVRIMRGVRSASKLGFEIEKNTKDTMKKMASDITKVSSERIKSELVKMAGTSGDKFSKAIMILDEVGILEIILPEITRLKEFKENPIHHPEAYENGEGTVFDHVLSALRKNKIKDPIINLSILFHDIGKSMGYDGGDFKFQKHASKSKELIDDIAKRLKLTTKEKNSIMFSAINHMKMHTALDMKNTKILKLVNDENWEILKQVSLCDDSCRIGLFDKIKFNNIINNMEKIQKQWGEKTLKNSGRIVDGKLVMKVTKRRPSKEVGTIIKRVTEFIIDNGLKLPLEELIKMADYELRK